MRTLSTAKASAPTTPMDKLEKITFGSGLPGYVCGSAKDPAVIVVQMSGGGGRSHCQRLRLRRCCCARWGCQLVPGRLSG